LTRKPESKFFSNGYHILRQQEGLLTKPPSWIFSKTLRLRVLCERPVYAISFEFLKVDAVKDVTKSQVRRSIFASNLKPDASNSAGDGHWHAQVCGNCFIDVHSSVPKKNKMDLVKLVKDDPQLVRKST
jgi:hypothetical protein